MTYGYSRDHRADLKQWMLALATTRQGDVPLFCQALDGNASDKVSLLAATATGDGVWATFEVACYGLRVTRDLTLYARSELNRFIHDLGLFAANRTGEVLLRTARPGPAHLRDVLPLWYAPQMEAPPTVEATLRIVELDEAWS